MQAMIEKDDKKPNKHTQESELTLHCAALPMVIH
jgi:hypothetical protein